MSSIECSVRPLSMRLAAVGVILFGLFSLLTAKGAQAQDRDSKPTSLEVVLLLDRSPSADVKSVSGRPLIEDRAQKLLNQLYSLCQFYGVELRYGAANFGGKLGDVRPLAGVLSPADLILPARKQISFTDFRGALRFGLDSLQRGSHGPQSRRIVFIFTDSEPWLATGPLNPESKNHYFGNAQEAPPDSLASSIGSLRESAVDLFVIALDDKQADARHWMDLLPADHYLSNRSIEDLDAAIRQNLLGLIDPSCSKTILSGTATPPQKAPPGDQSTSHSGSTRAPLTFPSPWYEIVLASAGALLGAVASRFLSRRPQPTDAVKGMPPLSVEDEEDQGPDDVEELRRRGRKIASIDLNKAKEFFERALEKSERTAQEGEEFAFVQIPAIFREILTTIFKDDLHAQREYIYQQASLKSSRQRARGLAPVLLERWSINSELMLEEFFALQHHPRGDECLQALAEFEPPEDWSPEKLALIRLIRDIATAEDDLQRTAEFYNG